uniref:Uncharacterized protein n=1 Tax=Oryza glaberrima TaxID=4538 RepID=I1P740_ORYGL
MYVCRGTRLSPAAHRLLLFGLNNALFFNKGGPCCAQRHGAQIRNRRRSLALGKIAQLADYSELKEHANSRMMPSDSSLYLCDQV